MSGWIQALKFERQLKYAATLAEFMCARLIEIDAAAPDVIVAVPLHVSRLRRRGYNQAHELARRIAASLDISMLPALLHRCRHTDEQSGLSAAARRRNLRGAFKVRKTTIPAHVALVDDVMTTASTLQECAGVLKKAGVARVDVWVAARAVKT